jgi:hypothetical protein
MAKYIIRKNDTVEIYGCISEEFSEIVQAFYFLLPMNTIQTIQQFAELIKQNYSLNNPRNKYVYEYLTKS